jgi:gamma-glutamyltranspeptidase/glutathione hydrolase
MVTTSQPLAAEAGLQILKRGGNAIDAAVATAAVLNLVEPMNVGIAGDLFAIIYIASENRLHVLNASGKAPTGQRSLGTTPWATNGILTIGVRAPACPAPEF